MNETKIVKWGNSQGIRIPKKMLKEIGIDNPDNQKVKMEVNKQKNEIFIKKEGHESRLMKKYGYLMDQPKDGEVDWGHDVGNEIIP
ncbi:AbrB/MazE/SpoVT family DNA-binding domain-containing protein [Fructilactobacillus fructivorans]|uniref:SpoVT-AbrB domain-containing protein n=1 Tax=Fructilactobacillus fructivorans TaxID=1614 RepID=A0A0C1PR38_9LACO|nr:AbrB/MazE/SpoVT family DNA-binding domain-containing protein [Fructilactobacillus fructivorans]KID42346.1 hypothetical protein LfDm3_0275 [Fructilactobacillus fructivorans]MCT0151037.1 AbrB/MazE/SpoVT family DNA-binding domain-containing protein [Fructilactobacillus fructivorans]MCT2867405.1 AbrB/MazE/SpoVT family DNA-binding domain-containing protein [Fructilactobacillus fructivorans]MCT2869076.1 AbrB/MazE/SpoVT family DNA-binding domain-containing protein [Fructilactobacillus fructivorans]